MVDTQQGEDIVGRLDLETKVRLLTGATFFTLHGEESVGLAPMAFSDGPTGVRGLEFSGGPKVCLLPNATLLAATWDTEALADVGRLLAEEAQRQQIHVVLGPTINLHRSPLGGRLFEAYSEDPLLTGVLATAYVHGLQGAGTGACLKHLVGNEAETERHTVDSIIDERTLREVYLLPFEIAVEDSDPWSVMAAYNNVNGVPATEHDEINNRILKGEWAWPGLLMSDWFATKSTAASANGGLDLVMPGPTGPWGDALVEAVRAGEVAEDVVDEHVRRLLHLAERVGALGEPRAWPTDLPAPDSEQRRTQLRNLAAAGMTVLTNDGTLPLAPDATVALIGRHATDTACMGGGSAQVRAPYQTSVADGLNARLGDRLTVVDGVAVRQRGRAARPNFVSDPVTGEPGVRLRLYGASGTLLDDRHEEDALAVVGMPGLLPEPPVRAELSAVLPAGAVRAGVLGIGSWRMRGPLDDAVELATSTGDVGEAVLRPPAHWADLELDGPTELVAEVALGPREQAVGILAEATPRTDDDAIASAVAAAGEADVAVVVVGLTEEQETEAVDKSTLALPGRQDELVAAVAAAAPRTVVVVNAATPVLMPWRDEVDAILWVGLPGQEGGDAVAAALLGEAEPTGRLVTSFPSADGSSPAWSVTPTGGALEYSEGPFLGYRGHAAGLAPEPAFWFGHGLGYASWEYGEAAAASTPEGIEVTVEVTNTSARDSREVVQAYLDPQADDHPVRLVGWAVIAVRAGETTTATVHCDRRMWRTWDTETHGWAPLGGGELVVARGLGDVRARLRSPDGGNA
jgi:beta-glucosidase